MKNNAKTTLIERLISTNLPKEEYSEKILFLLYEKYKKEVDKNILFLCDFQQAYLFLKKDEYVFLEIRNSYYKKKNIPVQLELFPNEIDTIKKNRN